MSGTNMNNDQTISAKIQKLNARRIQEDKDNNIMSVNGERIHAPRSLAHNGVSYVRADLLTQASQASTVEKEVAPPKPVVRDEMDTAVVSSTSDGIAMSQVLHMEDPLAIGGDGIHVPPVPIPSGGISNTVQIGAALASGQVSTALKGSTSIPAMGMPAIGAVSRGAGFLGGLMQSMIFSPQSQQSMSSGSGYNISSTQLRAGRPSKPAKARDIRDGPTQLLFPVDTAVMPPPIDNWYVSSKTPFDLAKILATPRLVFEVPVNSAGPKALVTSNVFNWSLIMKTFRENARQVFSLIPNLAGAGDLPNIFTADEFLLSLFQNTRYRVRVWYVLHLVLFERAKLEFLAMPANTQGSVTTNPSTSQALESFYPGEVHDFTVKSDFSLLLPSFEMNKESLQSGRTGLTDIGPRVTVRTNCQTWVDAAPPTLSVYLSIEPEGPSHYAYPSVHGKIRPESAIDEPIKDDPHMVIAGLRRVEPDFTVLPPPPSKTTALTPLTNVDLFGNFELFSTITYSGLAKDVALAVLPVAPSAFTSQVTDVQNPPQMICPLADASRYAKGWSGTIDIMAMVVSNAVSSGKLSLVHWPKPQLGASIGKLNGMFQTIIDLSVSRSAVIKLYQKANGRRRIFLNPYYNQYEQYGYDATSSAPKFGVWDENGIEMNPADCCNGWLVLKALTTLVSPTTGTTAPITIAWSVRPGEDFSFYIPILPMLQQARPVAGDRELPEIEPQMEVCDPEEDSLIEGIELEWDYSDLELPMEEDEPEPEWDYEIEPQMDRGEPLEDELCVMPDLPVLPLKDFVSWILGRPSVRVVTVNSNFVHTIIRPWELFGHDFMSKFSLQYRPQMWVKLMWDLPRGSVGKLEIQLYTSEGTYDRVDIPSGGQSSGTYRDYVRLGTSKDKYIANASMDNTAVSGMDRLVNQWRVQVGPDQPSSMSFQLPASHLAYNDEVDTFDAPVVWDVAIKSSVRVYGSTSGGTFGVVMSYGFGPETEYFNRQCPATSPQPQWLRTVAAPTIEPQMLREDPEPDEEECLACQGDCPGFCPVDLMHSTEGMLKEVVSHKGVQYTGTMKIPKCRWVPECERTTAPAREVFHRLPLSGVCWEQYLEDHYAMNKHHPQNVEFAGDCDMHKVRVIDVFSSISRSMPTLQDAWRLTMITINRDEGFCRECYTTAARDLYMYLTRNATVPFDAVFNRPLLKVIQWRNRKYIQKSWYRVSSGIEMPPMPVYEALSALYYQINTSMTCRKAIKKLTTSFPPMVRCLKEIRAHVTSVLELTRAIYPTIVEEHDFDKESPSQLLAYFMKWGLNYERTARGPDPMALAVAHWILDANWETLSYNKNAGEGEWTIAEEVIVPNNGRDEEVMPEGVFDTIKNVLAGFRPKVVDDISAAAAAVSSTAEHVMPVADNANSILDSMRGPIQAITSFVESIKGGVAQYLGDDFTLNDLIGVLVAFYSFYAAPSGILKWTTAYTLLRELGASNAVIGVLNDAVHAVSGEDENVDLNKVYQVTSEDNSDPKKVTMEDVTDKLTPNLFLGESFSRISESIVKGDTIKLGVPYLAFTSIAALMFGKIKNPQVHWAQYLKFVGSVAKDIMAITAASFLAYETFLIIGKAVLSIKDYFTRWYTRGEGTGELEKLIKDVEAWSNRVDAVCAHPLQTFIANEEQCAELTRTAAESTALIERIMKPEVKTSVWGVHLLRNIEAGQKFMHSITSALAHMAKDDPSRVTPFGLRLVGSPGVGKTVLSEILALTLAVSSGAPLSSKDNAFYTWDVSSKERFQEGYHNQPVVILDDPELGTLDSEWLYTIQKMISKTPFNVPKAACEAKGWWFKSKAVIVSTNMQEEQLRSTHTRCPEAYLRRFMNVEVKLRDGQKPKPDMSHLIFDIGAPKIATQPWEAKPGMTYNNFVNYLKNSFKKHVTNEELIVGLSVDTFARLVAPTPVKPNAGEDDFELDLSRLTHDQLTDFAHRTTRARVADFQIDRFRFRKPVTKVGEVLQCGCPVEVEYPLPCENVSSDVGVRAIYKHFSHLREAEKESKLVVNDGILFVEGKINEDANFRILTAEEMLKDYQKAIQNEKYMKQTLYKNLGFNEHWPNITPDICSFILQMYNRKGVGAWSVVLSLLSVDVMDLLECKNIRMSSACTTFIRDFQEMIDAPTRDTQDLIYAIIQCKIGGSLADQVSNDFVMAIQLLISADEEMDALSPFIDEGTYTGHISGTAPVIRSYAAKFLLRLKEYNYVHTYETTLKYSVHHLRTTDENPQYVYLYSPGEDFDAWEKIAQSEEELENMVQGEISFIRLGEVREELRKLYPTEPAETFYVCLADRVLRRRWHNMRLRIQNHITQPIRNLIARIPSWVKKLCKVFSIILGCGAFVLFLNHMFGKPLGCPRQMILDGIASGRYILAERIFKNGKTEIVEANGDVYNSIRTKGAGQATQVITANQLVDLPVANESIFGKCCVTNLGTISALLPAEKVGFSSWSRQHAVALGKGWFITTAHFFKVASASKMVQPICFQFPRQWFAAHLADIEVRYPWPNTDLAAFRFKTTGVEQFPITSQHFIAEKDLKNMRKGNPARFVYIEREGKPAISIADAQSKPLKTERVLLHADLCVDSEGIDYDVSTPEIAYTQQVARYWKYGKGGLGLCGALLFCTDPARPKILGIHIAGSGRGSGFASVVTREMIEGLLADAGGIAPECDPGIPLPEPSIHYEDDNPVIPVGDYAYYGELQKEHWTHMPPTTGFKKMPTFGLIKPNDREPAPSRQNDPRNIWGENMLKNCSEKYATVGVPFQPEDIVNFEAGFSQLCGGYEDDGFVLLDQDQSINGVPGTNIERMNVDTAPGFPYVTMPEARAGGKRGFLVSDGTDLEPHYSLTDYMQGQVNDFEDKASRGILKQTFYQDALKVELLPLEKTRPYEYAEFYGGEEMLGPVPIYRGPAFCGYAEPDFLSQVKPTRTWKPRLLSVPAMDRTIIARKYNAGFNNFLMQRRHELGVMVGINPESSEWLELAQSLHEKNILVEDNDFKNFDGSHQASIILMVGRIYHNFLMRDPTYAASEEHQNIQRVIWAELAMRNVVCQRWAYRVHHGLASGHDCTTQINCIAQIFYFFVAWCEIMKEEGLSELANFTSFWRNVRCVVYGDDGLKATRPEFARIYTAARIATCLLKYGITMTPASKFVKTFSPPRKISEVTFLSRGFVQHPTRKDVWYAPLKEESVDALLNWVYTKKRGTNDAICQNIEEHLRHLYPVGKTSYNQRLAKIREVMRTREPSIDLSLMPTWEELEAAFLANW